MGSGTGGAPASEADETLAPRAGDKDRVLGFGVGTRAGVGGNYFISARVEGWTARIAQAESWIGLLVFDEDSVKDRKPIKASRSDFSS
jgi:hypothetical protein